MAFFEQDNRVSAVFADLCVGDIGDWLSFRYMWVAVGASVLAPQPIEVSAIGGDLSDCGLAAHEWDECQDLSHNMPTFSTSRPSQFDQTWATASTSEVDRDDWIVAPCLITRDSPPLEISNWETMQAILDDAGIEYEIHRHAHWGPGWIEICIVEPTEVGIKTLESIIGTLANYPVLNEDDLAEREDEDAIASWSAYGQYDFVRWLANEFDLHETTVDFLHEADIPMVGYETHGDGAHFLYADAFETRDSVAKLIRELRSAESE